MQEARKIERQTRRQRAAGHCELEITHASGTGGGELLVIRYAEPADWQTVRIERQRRAPGAGENISRTLVVIRADVVPACADYNGGAAERDSIAEEIAPAPSLAVSFCCSKKFPMRVKTYAEP